MKASIAIAIGLLSLVHPILAFQLRTSSTVPSIKKSDLHNFLATPSNWPRIVLSSHSVKRPSFAANNVDVPLKVGEFVEEVFGLPPLLPLSVVWECVTSDVPSGSLEFYSEDGVAGLADRCTMKFDIREDGNGCSVDLTMEFEARSPIVPLGIPLLSVDNGLALNVLLPRAIREDARQ